MHLSKTKLAVIALIIANVIWGAASPIYKWALGDIHPYTFGFLRFFIAAVILFPFVFREIRIHKSDIPNLIILSLLGMTVNIGFLLLGLELSDSITAPVIGAAAPVFIVLGSLMFLKEKMKMRVFIGTFLSLIGVLVVVLRPIFEHGSHSSIIGNIFYIISTFGTVGYTLMLKRLAKKYPPMSLTFWTFLIGALGFVPFFIYELMTSPSPHLFAFNSLFAIAYAAIFSSILAYGFYTYALKYLVASEVRIFLYMDPIVTVLVAIPLLGESITYFFFLGSILVFLGIFIAERRIHYHPFHLLLRKTG